jgi:eukaryotic-like serine/threonine-protein kinase
MPEKIGRYEDLEVIGRGGMGMIYKARDPVLERSVALKVISSVEITADLSARFFREARACARLRDHPNIVTIYDMGEDAGRLYIVMELLEGEELRRLIARHAPLTLENKLAILRQLCDGLHHAHQRGIVHRDIKPANIFLCRYGEEYDFVKVLDFGIVGTVRDSGEASPMHTRENAPPGTPAFMAPEQAMGPELDGRADIYATGCVAYWLLTGQFVFTADSPMGLLLHHAQTPPPPASTRTSLPIPASLDDLVLSCLAKDPADRPQSARELSLRLGDMEGADGWTQDRAREWWVTHHVP